MNIGWLSKSDGVCTVCCNSTLSPAVSDRLKDGMREVRTKIEALQAKKRTGTLYEVKTYAATRSFQEGVTSRAQDSEGTASSLRCDFSVCPSSHNINAGSVNIPAI